MTMSSSSWHCVACTYRNNNWHGLACAVCSTARYHDDHDPIVMPSSVEELPQRSPLRPCFLLPCLLVHWMAMWMPPIPCAGYRGCQNDANLRGRCNECLVLEYLQYELDKANKKINIPILQQVLLQSNQVPWTITPSYVIRHWIFRMHILIGRHGNKMIQ